MDADLAQRISRIEVEVKVLRHDVSGLRSELRGPLQLVDRHEQLLARLAARPEKWALWLGVGAGLLTAAASLWLSVSTARSQPNVEDLAQALAPRITAAMHR